MTRPIDLLAKIEQRYRDDPNMYWVTEVKWLIGEAKRLQVRLTESEAENDQWQKKLAEVWAENTRLRDELRTCQETLTACLESE